MTAPAILPHLFRTEYSKIIAVLCRSFGLHEIEMAEDIASDTFLKAAETWSLNGLPPNPSAWLYTVAKNATKDHLKRKSIFAQKVEPALNAAKTQIEEIDFNDALIADSQLAMIFAVCHPGNARETQVAMALQILCGFSVQEIATAFLTNPDTIKKRLQRARSRLREDNFQLRALTQTAIQSRLEAVQRTIYLLFNEGYFSVTGDFTIRKDCCLEAIRLARLLTENPDTATPETHALLSLLCFQASRLDARTSQAGELVPLEEQDRAQWDQSLIDAGNQYLIDACKGENLSKYHLEAAIAYWHTTPANAGKWQHILPLYDQLMLLDNSPVVAINRIFAVAQVNGPQKAIDEVGSVEIEENELYHALMGYLYAALNARVALLHYEQAYALSRSSAERQIIEKRIRELQ